MALPPAGLELRRRQVHRDLDVVAASCHRVRAGACSAPSRRCERIRPVSSAIWMNWPGETVPRTGWFQRINASNPAIRLLFEVP